MTITHHLYEIASSRYAQEYRDVERFEGYCRRCECYGTKWTCPPIAPDRSVDPFMGLPYLYLIGTQVSFSEQERTRPSSMDEMVALSHSIMRTVRRMIDPLLLECESSEVAAMAYYAGRCWVCDEPCTRAEGLPCRHPKRARTSLEALGFDLVRTASELLHLPMKWGENSSLPPYSVYVSGIASALPIAMDGIEQRFAPMSLEFPDKAD